MAERCFRVLVADDHDGIRECLVHILSSEFTVIGQVADGRELVEAAIRCRSDAIVSDVRMPGLTGTEAMRALLEAGYDIPFIFVTGDKCLAEHVSRALGICIHKVDAVRQLNPAVHRMVGLRRQSLAS